MEETISPNKRYGRTAIHEGQCKEFLFFAEPPSMLFLLQPHRWHFLQLCRNFIKISKNKNSTWTITARQLSYLIFFLSLALFPFERSYSQEYELSEEALNAFIEGKGNLNISVDAFVAKYNGKKITLENKKWCPENQSYIEYRYLQLRYWFNVIDSKHNDYLNKLESMISSDEFIDFRKYGYIKTSNFSIGECVDEAELMGSKFLQSIVSEDAKALIVFRTDLQKAFSNWQIKNLVDEKYSPLNASQDYNNSMQVIGNFQKEMNARLKGREIGEKISKLKNKYYKQAGLDIHKENEGLPYELGKANLNENPSNVLKKYGINSPNTANGKKGGSDGKDNPGGDGNSKKSWLPIKVSFSEWFGHLLEIVTEYLGIDNITKQMLSVAYFIAPELFDEVGSFFAKIQHSLTPKSLDDFLNNVSDIVEHLHKFYQCATAIKAMFADPEFQALFKGDLKKLPVDKILKGIENGSALGNHVGLISGRNLNAIQSITGYGLLLSEEDLARNLSQFAYQKAKGFLLNTKIGNHFPFLEMENCYKTKSKDDCLKILTQGTVMNLPKQFSKYGNALDNFIIKGDFKGAAKEAAMQEINRIPKEFRADVKKIIEGKGDSLFNKYDLKRISENVLKSTGNNELASLIKIGRGINYVSEYANKNAKNIKKGIANALSEMNLSEEAIAEFLKDDKPELMRIMAKGFGFTDIEAQNLFITGNINEAIQKQVQKGVPVRNWAYYQQLGQEIRNKTLSRIGIYQFMLEAMKQCNLPYDFTRLIQNSK